MNLKIIIFSNDKTSYSKIKFLEEIVENSGGIIIDNIFESDFIIIPDTILINLNDECFINYNRKILSEQFLLDINNNSINSSEIGGFNSNLLNPLDYLYENINLKKILKEIRAEYGNLEIDELPNLFDGQIFYIDSDVSKEYKDLNIYCVSLCGGTYIEIKCSIVNYAITNNRNFELSSKLNNIIVVNPLYLIQCTLKKEKLNPKDFYPISNLVLEDKSNKSYNIDKITSKILEGLTFFILTPTYNQKTYSSDGSKFSLYEIKDLIYSNSGNLIDDINKINCVDYVIANDGFCDVVAKFIDEHKNYKFIAVSHRYISYCIEQRKIVKLKDEKLFHIFPMPFSVPYSSFEKISIKFKGFSPLEESKYKLIAEMIGADCGETLPVTHLIVSEDSFGKVSDYKQKLKEQNYNNVKFVKLEWLLECCISGVVLDEKNFEIN